MTYHHKRGPCLKETKEILDNILRMKKSDYEIQEISSSTTSKQKIKEVIDKTNVLPGDAAALLGSEGTTEDVENYKSNQELDFEVEDVKDCLEKKKKRRNYIEFRSDYEKS